MLPEWKFDEKTGSILKDWRKSSHITQDDMAARLGTTRQSILKIEHGATHSKSYTLYLYGKITGHNPSSIFIDSMSNNKAGAEEIVDTIMSMDNKELSLVRKIIFKNHGTDFKVLIHLCAAYLMLPMIDRQRIALQIISDYELYKNHASDIEPDIALLKKAQKKGREAAINGKERYEIK